MKVSTFLKVNGSSVVEFIDNNVEHDYPTVAILDYKMCCQHVETRVDGFYYCAACLVPEEVTSRNIDFITSGKSFNHDGDYVDSVRVFLKKKK